MLLDWVLASLHHLAVFTLAAILAFELALTGGERRRPRHRCGWRRVDAWYGASAALALAAGVARVFLGAKGPEYYGANFLFWLKMALFAAVAPISVLPTLRYIVWRRATRLDPDFSPDAAAVAAVRRALWSEVALFAFIPLAAAGIARGYGIEVAKRKSREITTAYWKRRQGAPQPSRTACRAARAKGAIRRRAAPVRRTAQSALLSSLSLPNTEFDVDLVFFRLRLGGGDAEDVGVRRSGPAWRW